MFKRAVSFLLAGALVCSCYPAATLAATNFSDVSPNYWAAPAIDALASQGAFQGVIAGTTFNPEAPFTRGQLAGILQVAMGWKTANVGPPFSDVTASDPFYGAIETVAGRGVMRGVGGGQFDATGFLNRAEAATIFARALGLGHAANDQAKGGLGFTDAAAIPTWARGAAVVAESLGLMQGWGGKFHPNVPLTRAQVAEMVYRMENLTPAQISQAAAPAASYVTAGPSGAKLDTGGTLKLWAAVHDMAGYVLPVQVQWTATAGTVAGGDFTAGNAPGPVTLTATVPGKGLEAPVQLEVYQPTALRFAQANPQIILAGNKVTWGVRVTNGAADNGRPVSLTVTGPGGSQTLQAQDQGGDASFNLQETQAGFYSVVATAGGLTQASASLQAVAAPLGILQVAAPGTVAPWTNSNLVVTTSIAPSLPVPVTVTSSNAAAVQVGEATTKVGGTAGLTGGPVPGTATVTVSAPGGAYLPATVQVSESPQGELSFGAATYSAAAGNPVQVTVSLVGAGAAGENGTQVALTAVSPTGVKLGTLTADTVNGAATFTLTEDEAGAYKLKAVAWGCLAPAEPAVLTVSPGPAVGFNAQINPSPFLLPGQTAQVWAALVDKYGNPTANPVSASAGITPGTSGTLEPDGGNGQGVIGVFHATAPGSATITVTAAGYRPVALPVRVVADPAQLVAGKGMWLLYPTWRNTSDATLLATAAAEGITHIYLEVATSNDGFYGGPGLDNFLAKAHAAGIAVISWVYPALWHPVRDTADGQRVAAYTTPTGQRADGMALDIEANLNPQTVGQYAQAIRTVLGPEGLLVGVTYPPLYHDSYPYSVLAQYAQVLAPMDYWHSLEKDYSYAGVYNYVAYSIQEIRKLAGNPNLPIEVIAQGYDIYGNDVSGAYSPTVLEEQGAARAAVEGGAVGISFYRQGSLTQDEMNFIEGLNWPGAGGGG